MLSTVHSGTLIGISAHHVVVEAHLGRGLPGFDLVGLPEAAVRESRVRVKAAITNSNFELPPKHIVLNLAPADLRKTGTAIDLAIATALLSAAGACAPNRLDHTMLIGELSLTGELRPVRGVLSFLRAAEALQFRSAIIPEANATDAALFNNIDVYCARRLSDVVAFLNSQTTLPTAHEVLERNPSAHAATAASSEDFSEIRGQESAKRALQIAAVGAHNILLTGPPGAGKTMLARRLISILREPTHEESLEIATIAGVAGFELSAHRSPQRPFRAPHHSASDVALIGGGDPIRPGEVTLAHAGVLFLDELPEFRRTAIESLRITMESGLAHVARARMRVTMPAKPIVVAAMNPCPCGYARDARRECICSLRRVAQYNARISGPILDRFDIHIRLSAVRSAALRTSAPSASSKELREQVADAQRFACERRRSSRGLRGDRDCVESLADLTACVTTKARHELEYATDKFDLSARAYTKLLRVARTIADLAHAGEIDAVHMHEALSYRAAESPQKNQFASTPLTENRA